MTPMKNPCHPGEVLEELYLGPMGLSRIALARGLHVPRTRIERLVKGETSGISNFRRLLAMDRLIETFTGRPVPVGR